LEAGIPYTPVIAGGGIVNFRIENIWVETQVPYANYRGAVIDEYGKTWLGLDTSLKVTGYTYNEPEEIPEEMALSGMRESYLEDIRVETPLQYIQGETGDYLEQYLPGTTYDDLVQVRTFLPEEVEILPASLQFRQIAVTGEYTRVPDDLIHKARFTAAGPDGNDLFDITLEAYRLSNKSLSLTYEPETVEDQEIINAYEKMEADRPK